MSCTLCIPPFIPTLQEQQKVKKLVMFGRTTASSLHTLRLDSTYDPFYCKSGPSDRDSSVTVEKGVAIKYNSYTRYLNRMRKKNCA
jgi:hypothetical protein